MPSQLKDIHLGKVIGRLTVISYAGKRKRGHFWKCQCSCGKTSEVFGWSLATGRTISCGCYRADATRAMRLKHGHTIGARGGNHVAVSKEYRAWQNAKDRCYRPNRKNFKDYGGRGIRVCDRWRDSFSNFLADMGQCPAGKSLDRFPNMNGNYEPGNCRWATVKEQMNNTRRNRKFRWQGKSLSLCEIADLYQITSSSLRRRVIERGQNIKQVVKKMIEKKADTASNPLKRYLLDGEMLTIYAIGRKHGVHVNELRNRVVHRGEKLQSAIRHMQENIRRAKVGLRRI